MRKVLLISPHFDDAVLSAGQFMAERPDCEVITVFAGMPLTPERVKTPYDNKCGFDNAQDAMAERQRENDAALALLEATAIDLDFIDSQYENEVIKTHVDDIVEALQNIIDENDYEFIMAPIGLGHPDHMKVNEAVLRLKTDLPIYFWEDLPLRVVDPLTVIPRLAMFGFTEDKLWQPATTNDKMAKKARSLLCYKSQIYTGILDPYVMYVPERFWAYK